MAVADKQLNKPEVRIDTAQSRTSVSRLDGIEYTSQGYLKARAFITRVGVFNYRKEDGTVIRELRLPEEVFASESLKSLCNIPLTDNHPPVMLTAENTKEYLRGYLFNDVWIEAGTYVASDVLVTDSEVIRKIQIGLNQLSAGYNADIEYTSGIHPIFGEYDAIQRNIRHNHVSRVDLGRAGDEVKVRFDAIELEEGCMPKDVDVNDDQVADSSIEETKTDSSTKDLNSKKGDGPMPTIKLDGVEIQVSEAAALAINAELQRKDSAYAELKIERDQFEAQRDQYKTDAEEATAKLDSVDVAAMVSETVKAMSDAQPFLPQDAKTDGLSAVEIKKLAIGNVYPDLKLQDKSEVYVSARFDALIEKPSNPDYSQAFSNIINSVPAKSNERVDSDNEHDPMAAFNEMAADLKNSGKKGE